MLIRRVGTESGLPVTYADVRVPIAPSRGGRRGLFVTVHIIPYWDDDPVGIDDVIPYDRLYAEMRRRFGKEVRSARRAGRRRTTARRERARPREPARYIREFTALAAALPTT
jgi:glucan 1,3-beta-glucosidase